MKVRDVMAKTIAQGRKDEKLSEIARKMQREDAGFIPIVEGDRLVGAVTDRDIVIRCVAEGHDVTVETVEHIMTREVETIGPDEEIDAAAGKMEKREVRRLPVVDNGRLLGVLSHGNLVQALKGRGSAEKATLGVTKGA
jgi:CBS domain-containing protein